MLNTVEIMKVVSRMASAAKRFRVRFVCIERAAIRRTACLLYTSVEKDGVFYLYYKDEAKKCIRYAVADCLTGPYREPEENEVSLSRKHVEGNFIYRIVGTDTFVMMMDEYTNGRFFLQQTEDLIHFKKLRRRDYSLDFQPRHGSVLAVGEGTYQTLLEAYGNS